MERVIPSSYFVYLLRSRRQRQEHYIGSTPSIFRRLRQHNGNIKGGAKKTAWTTRKPWEVICVVHGFPSNIAALQFEWAWDHPDMTRHIMQTERLTAMRTVEKTSRKTGRIYKKRLKTFKLPFPDILANLLRLLSSPSFRRLPLSVRYFSAEMHEIWREMKSRTHVQLPQNFEDHLDAVEWPQLPPRMTLKKVAELPAEVLENREAMLKQAGAFVPAVLRDLDLKYRDSREQLLKSVDLLGGAVEKCSVCQDLLEPQAAATIVCPHGGCRAVSHLSCLADRAAGDDQHQGLDILPSSSTCVQCGTQTQWAQLMKELSLRLRGEREIAALLKPPRKTKAVVDDDSDVSNEDTANDLTESEDGDLDDQLQHVDDDDCDEVSNPDDGYLSHGMSQHRLQPGKSVKGRQIDDSESGWSNAEVLT